MQKTNPAGNAVCGNAASTSLRLWLWHWLPALPFILLPLLPAALHAQQQAVLTEKQTDDLRDAAQDPEARIKLYIGFIDERTTDIRQLAAHSAASGQSARLHSLYQQFTELADELSDNMDDYDQQHGDMRKVLTLVVDKTGEWNAALKAPKSDDAYQFERASAVDACQDVHDDAAQILAEQTKYFADQKMKEKQKKKQDSGGG